MTEQKQPGTGKRDSNGWIVAAAVAAVVAGTVCWYRGFSFSATARENWRALADGFFTAGVVVGGMGALSVVAATGFFDMLTYGLQGLWIRLTPFMHPKGQMPFDEYREARVEKRGPKRYTMVIVGLVCILLSLIFTLLFQGAVPAAA